MQRRVRLQIGTHQGRHNSVMPDICRKTVNHQLPDALRDKGALCNDPYQEHLATTQQSGFWPCILRGDHICPVQLRPYMSCSSGWVSISALISALSASSRVDVQFSSLPAQAGSQSPGLPPARERQREEAAWGRSSRMGSG